MFNLLAPVVLSVTSVGLFGELFSQPRQRDQLGVHKGDWLTVSLGLLPGLGVLAVNVEAWVRGPVDVNPLAFGLGLVLCLACIVIRTWGKYTLGYYYTFSIDLRDDHRVIEDGPYRFVRHPLYLGAFLGVAGLPLLAHSWIAVLALTLPTGFAFGLRLILEDKFLLQNLGDSYREYAGRTSRLIPFVW
ncbi:MAG: isoprenylcysteine carboxylmethyltransferase family protein [Elusimicrobiota bacterium]